MRVIFNEYKNKLMGAENDMSYDQPGNHYPENDYFGQQDDYDNRQNMTNNDSVASQPRSGGFQSQVMNNSKNNNPSFSTSNRPHAIGKNFKDTSIMNQSIAMGARPRNETSNIFKNSPKTSKKAEKTRTDFDRDQDASWGGNTIMDKKPTSVSNLHQSKLHSDISPMGQNR